RATARLLSQQPQQGHMTKAAGGSPQDIPSREECAHEWAPTSMSHSGRASGRIAVILSEAKDLGRSRFFAALRMTSPASLRVYSYSVTVQELILAKQHLTVTLP